MPGNTSIARSTPYPTTAPTTRSAKPTRSTTLVPWGHRPCRAAGLLTEQATASTDSTDPDVTNNAAATTVDVFRSVTIDIQPGDSTNVVQLKRGGLISVAILSTPQFNASTVDSATVCFGDAEAPAERTCAEVHGHGHLAEVNRDGRADMVLHYDVSATGIDLGDHSACLKGRTTAGVGIYGCDAVSP